MAFYLTVPRGNISLQKLSQFTLARFQFLEKIAQSKGDQVKMLDVMKECVEQSDCLIEGSVKDKISHFILRVVCSTNSDMTNFLLEAETMLFEFRFSCMSLSELLKLFKSLDHHVRKAKSDDKVNLYSDTVRKTLLVFGEIKCQWKKWGNIVEKYLQGGVECFTVPFQTVLPLVATRKVNLNRGMASVPVCYLRQVVTGLFRQMLQSELQIATRCFCTEDERILGLIKTIKALYRQTFRYADTRVSSRPRLSSTEVDSISSAMPPCMSHLRRTLRNNHRLRHHYRIQYTLFLKEAGMSVHDALIFWRKEYSQLPSNHGGCSHDWAKNESRYTYSIRHLYGLEGSRINYKAHSCASLQESCQNVHDGGCPFSHFDQDHLLDLLQTEGICDSLEQILHLAAVGHYSVACRVFFAEKTRGLEQKRYDNCRLSKTISENVTSRCDKVHCHASNPVEAMDWDDINKTCQDVRNATSKHSCQEVRNATSKQNIEDSDGYTVYPSNVSVNCARDSWHCEDGETSMERSCADRPSNVSPNGARVMLKCENVDVFMASSHAVHPSDMLLNGATDKLCCQDGKLFMEGSHNGNSSNVSLIGARDELHCDNADVFMKGSHADHPSNVSLNGARDKLHCAYGKTFKESSDADHLSNVSLVSAADTLNCEGGSHVDHYLNKQLNSTKDKFLSRDVEELILESQEDNMDEADGCSYDDMCNCVLLSQSVESKAKKIQHKTKDQTCCKNNKPFVLNSSSFSMDETVQGKFKKDFVRTDFTQVDRTKSDLEVNSSLTKCCLHGQEALEVFVKPINYMESYQNLVRDLENTQAGT